MVHGVSTQNAFVKNLSKGPRINLGNNSPNLVRGSDSASVSQAATRMTELMERYNSLTSINGQPIQQLRAINNRLTILWNIPYRFEFSAGFLQYILFHANGTDWNRLFTEVYNEIGAEGDFFDQPIFRQEGNAFAILSKLAGGAAGDVNGMYSRSEIIDALTAAGIEPGWAEIDNGHEVNRFYFTRCGTIRCEWRMDAARVLLNERDFRRPEYGYQPGDKVMINFEYFTVGEDGRIFVPDDVPVIWGATIWSTGRGASFGWSQDEKGEWQRELNVPPFVSILSDEYWGTSIESGNQDFSNPFVSPTFPRRYGDDIEAANTAIMNYANRLSSAIRDLKAVMHSLSQRTDNNAVLQNALDDLTKAYETIFGDITNASRSDTENQVNYLQDALLMTSTYLYFLDLKINEKSNLTQSIEEARTKAEEFIRITT
ncbi:MAG: hypothetical protein FWF81_10465 [Defluviitaleaceae bacterium]|nr:hypothetical protein [Defluviitaleaceae bacterium]